MKNRLPVFLFAALMAAPMLLSTPVQAQDRGEDTWYLRPRLGLSYYLGTNDNKLDFKKGDLFENVPAPFNGAIEVGYRYGPKYTAGIALAYSMFGNINDFNQDDAVASYEEGAALGLQLIGRRFFRTGKVQPFIQLGLALNFTDTNQRGPDGLGGPAQPSEFKIGGGPLFGYGLDIRLNDRVSLGLETGGVYVFPDIAADGADGGEIADWLGWNTVSVGFDLKSFNPVMVGDVVCPVDVVATGSPVTFTGSVNMDATPMVETSWDFGDGATASGMTATHSFSQEGTYNVTFAASNGNGRGMDSRTCVVSVEDPVVGPQIVSMTASNMGPDTMSNVGFSSNVTGTMPMTYSWDFGDGTTSSEANPSHMFSEPGTYTVTVEACNEAGCDTRTMEITVVQYEAAICREIEEMNSAFFARNSSTLTAAGRAALQDNLEILVECPNLNARVEGWAAPGERRPQQLSEDRARAIEQFYVDNGVSASRLVTAGMGRAQGVTSKKEGLEGFRRGDTIPVRM